MAAHVSRKKCPSKHLKTKSKPTFQKKSKPWKLEEKELSSLQEKYQQIHSESIKTFDDFPLSNRTLEGLKELKFKAPTEIQRESIGLALQGHDVLGAAKTGSGKTLAFLIPVLECLYRQKWSQFDGLGALVISPTRELAYQTFEVLRRVGKKHDFSAGLVIGGKHLKEEAERINRTNIIICTPGRLLQHMDETFNFTANSLQILVLDEADRILDLGFSKTMNAIIENLPPDRQTLLFSATQTKSVKDLARLSLKDPMYVSVHEHAKHKTPSQLRQSYVTCELHDKLNFIWSFIKHHLKQKVLIFVSSCKQVRYIYEQFRHLRPGNAVLALHGGMNQLKRVDVYRQFVRKEHAVLFATDIAARGLDFPKVHWVIQLDCPEDTNTYIHRAGRTARYEQDGESLLILLPSEKVMIDLLLKQKIPIEQIRANPKRLWQVQGKLESLCASNVEIKEMAQRAFVAYLKSVYLMSNKKVFDVHKLDMDTFSRSLGLALSPRVRFLEKDRKRLEEKSIKVSSKQQTNNKQKIEKENSINDELSQEMDSSSDESESDASDSSEVDSTEESKNNQNRTFGENVDSDEDILTVKKTGVHTTLDDDANEIDTEKVEEKTKDDDTDIDTNKKQKGDKFLTKYAIAKKLKKKNLKVNTKIVFDEDGEIADDSLTRQKTSVGEDENYEGGINIGIARKIMEKEDQVDKRIFRERIKKKHKEERIKRKEKKRAENPKEQDDESEGKVAYLGADDDNEDNEGSDASYISEEYDNEEPSSKKQKISIKENYSDTDMAKGELNDRGDISDNETSDMESDDSKYSDDSDDATESDEDNTIQELTLKDKETLALKFLQQR